MKLKPGDLFFVHSIAPDATLPQKLYPFLIKLRTKLKYGVEPTYTHVGIILTDLGNNHYRVGEALSDGFKIHENAWGGWIENYCDVARFDVKLSQTKLLELEYIIQFYKNKGYDWYAIFAIFLDTIGIPYEYTNANKLICSEAISLLAYQWLGIDMAKGIPHDRRTPYEISLCPQLTWVHVSSKHKNDKNYISSLA